MHDGMGAVVTYVGGLPGHQQRNLFSGHHTLLAIEPDSLVIRHAFLGGFWSTWRYETLLDTRWPDVLSLRFEPSGQRSVNVLAVAAFGVLAAGSGTNTTLITATCKDATVYFTTGAPLYEWSALRDDLSEYPDIVERFHVGAPPEPAAPAATRGDVVTQLAQLADLRAQGHLSAEEFATAKAVLLSS